MIAALTAAVLFVMAMTYLKKFRKVMLYLVGVAFGLALIIIGGTQLDGYYSSLKTEAAQPANYFDRFDTPAAAPKPAKIADRQQSAAAGKLTVVPSEHYRADGTRDDRLAITPQLSPPGSGGLVFNLGPAPAAAPGWYVSLKSSPDERALQRDIPGMTDEYKFALGDVQLSSKIVDLGAKSTYRLVAGPLGTQGEAEELCQKIKGIGGGRACFV